MYIPAINVKMINKKQIESLGWFRSALASSHYEDTYFLKGTLSPEDKPSGVWLIQMGKQFRIISMVREWHEVLFLGYIEKHEDLVNLMRMLNLSYDKGVVEAR